MSSPFFFDDSTSRAGSDDPLSDASDFEHLCSTDEPGTLEDVHYWYGKLYLAFRLAKSIVREVGPDITADELDMELMKRTVDIPYSARLSKLDHGRVVDASAHQPGIQASPYGAYIVTVGNLARHNTPDSEKSLDILIRGCESSASGAPEVPQPQPQPSSDHVSHSDQATTSAKRLETQGVNIAQYTMALMETVDSSGYKPSYSSIQHTLDPPSFEVKVSVEGGCFEGHARTKKQAKHLASQKACQRLGISI